MSHTWRVHHDKDLENLITDQAVQVVGILELFSQRRAVDLPGAP